MEYLCFSGSSLGSPLFVGTENAISEMLKEEISRSEILVLHQGSMEGAKRTLQSLTSRDVYYVTWAKHSMKPIPDHVYPTQIGEA